MPSIQTQGHTMKKTPEERFWSKVDKTNNSNGCWEWKGNCNENKYGRIQINNKKDSQRFSAIKANIDQE